MTVFRQFVLRLLVLVAVLAPGSAPAAPDVPEYELKSAFLYNFALFVEWPGLSGETVTLCIAGNDPFGPALAAVEGKPVGARRFAVRRLGASRPTVDCQMLFIPVSERERLAALTESLRRVPVLTVTEADGATRTAAMISLAVADGRVAFDIDATAAREAGVVISSKLLRLARRVY